MIDLGGAANFFLNFGKKGSLTKIYLLLELFQGRAFWVQNGKNDGFTKMSVESSKSNIVRTFEAAVLSRHVAKTTGTRRRDKAAQDCIEQSNNSIYLGENVIFFRRVEQKLC